MTRKLSSSKLSSLCGLTALFIGLTVAIGWLANWTYLIQTHPSFVPMQFNTALGFLTCGIALTVINLNFKDKFVLFGVVAIALGGLILVEYIFALDFGIDQLAKPVIQVSKTGAYPGKNN